jgi:hypothetical protein
MNELIYRGTHTIDDRGMHTADDGQKEQEQGRSGDARTANGTTGKSGQRGHRGDHGGREIWGRQEERARSRSKERKR